jgi:dTDP-4-amino-4,6-dideoxygalactose transaminase
MGVFQGRFIEGSDLREAEQAAQEVLSLPMEPLMSEDELNYVIDAVRGFAE